MTKGDVTINKARNLRENKYAVIKGTPNSQTKEINIKLFLIINFVHKLFKNEQIIAMRDEKDNNIGYHKQQWYTKQRCKEESGYLENKKFK